MNNNNNNNNKKCDCSDCHKTDTLLEALNRLEERDKANARIINEMYAKILSFTQSIERLERRGATTGNKKIVLKKT